MSDMPPLFETIPDRLMVPLASPLKAVYWEALMVAYRRHQDSGIREITRESLLDELEDHWLEAGLRHPSSAEEWADDEESLPDYPEPRLFAWRVLRQLERCGWLEYEFHKDLGQTLRIPDYALQLISTLKDIAGRERPRVKGLAYNVMRILTDAEEIQRDPGFALYQAKDAVVRLVDELKLLAGNIGRYVERAARDLSVGELLSLHLNEFWPEVVEPSYQQFKTSDNVLKFRLTILDRLDELAGDGLFVQEAAACVETQENVSAERAKMLVHEWLEDMSSEIRLVDGLIEEIDRRHAHYAGLMLERIRHRLHRNETTESRLVNLIQQLQALPDSAEEAWGDLADVYRLEHAGEDSLYRVPSASEVHEAEPLANAEISEERRRELLSRTQAGFSNPLARQKIFAEVEEQLQSRGAFDLADVPIDDDAAFLQLIAIHAYQNDEASPYNLRVSPESPVVQAGRYRFRNARIERRTDS